jgi:hypothetical protein
MKEKETPIVKMEPTPPAVDQNQAVETNAYVPTYKIKPEFKRAVLECIGDQPFNAIAGLIQAINVETMDHQTLTQIINAMGQFPYTRVEKFMASINMFVEQNIED